jgi:predicted solute-binding protein
MYERDQHGDAILIQVNDATAKAQHEDCLLAWGDESLQVRYEYNTFRQWIKK